MASNAAVVMSGVFGLSWCSLKTGHLKMLLECVECAGGSQYRLCADCHSKCLDLVREVTPSAVNSPCQVWLVEGIIVAFYDYASFNELPFNTRKVCGYRVHERMADNLAIRLHCCSMSGCTKAWT